MGSLHIGSGGAYGRGGSAELSPPLGHQFFSGAKRGDRGGRGRGSVEESERISDDDYFKRPNPRGGYGNSGCYGRPHLAGKTRMAPYVSLVSQQRDTSVPQTTAEVIAVSDLHN